MKRKAIIYIILSFSSALSVFSQVYDNEPTIYEKYYGSKDENHGYEVLTDEQFNDREAVFFIYTLDGEYIGPSNIGIDLYSVKMSNPKSYQEPTLTVPFMVYGIGPKRDSLYVDCTMEEMRRLGRNYTIGGRRVTGIYNFTSLKGHVELLTLEEIRQKYCPKVKKPYVFMINKFFIFRDQDLYKVDKDFIYNVEVVNLKKCDVLKRGKAFNVIRIFTKTHHNWHPSHIN